MKNNAISNDFVKKQEILNIVTSLSQDFTASKAMNSQYHFFNDYVNAVDHEPFETKLHLVAPRIELGTFCV